MPKTQRKMEIIEKKLKEVEDEEKRCQKSREKLERKKKRRKSQGKLKCAMLDQYATSRNRLDEKEETLDEVELP